MTDPTERSVGRVAYRDVIRHSEVRALLLAQTASDLGSQISRVAIALLVLSRTDSLVLAALALAVSYIPAIFGTAVLGSLADRFPRRAVMLWCDAIRFVLTLGLAALAGADGPLLLLFVLLLASETAGAPFFTARGALLPDIVPDRATYVAAQGLSRTINLGAQVFGFVLGGAVVALVGPRSALLLDALTFLVSYLFLRMAVRPRPSAGEAGTSVRRMTSDLVGGFRELMGDPVRRVLVLFGWGAALFLIAPEAVALGYAEGSGPLVGSILLAAVPAGSAVGILVVPRISQERQLELLLPLAGLSCLPLFVTSTEPSPTVAFVLWFISGALQAFMLTIITTVTMLTRAERRGSVLGIAAAGFNFVTAVSFVLVGAIAEVIGPARAVSVAGACGLLLLLVVRLRWPAERLAASAAQMS